MSAIGWFKWDEQLARPRSRCGALAWAPALLLALSACGGGGGASPDPATGQAGTPAPTAIAPDDAGAHRMLAQASFGATPQSIAQVKAMGYAGWIDEQLQGPGLQVSHLSTVETASSALGTTKPRAAELVYSWWTHSVQDPAQLKQRVAYALSQIFVVSTQDSTLGDNSRMVASYLDMLTDKSTGTYRDLLEAVALHPAMGTYLSHLRNRKEDPVSGRVPDENFAREVMQLFSIGLYELNDDGSLKLRNGLPVETYGPQDIKGLAKVFTGWSVYRPPGNTAAWWECFWTTPACKTPSQEVMPMVGYTQEHSTAEKRFLGVVVPAQSTADPATSLKIALDRLSTHPNTAPFISRQLIQRLVTSNPSPAYIARISQVFRNSGGQLKAVVKAILLDREARDPANSGIDMTSYGKLREPVLRLAQLLRAVPHTSSTFASRGSVPFYMATNTDDQVSALGQTPMNAPSVFNFYRPGYKPAQSQLATRQMVSPELQITSETSVLGYAQFMATTLDSGWGAYKSDTNKLDIQFDLTPLMALDTGSSDNGAQALVNEASQRLLGQPLPADAQARAVQGVSALPRTTPAAKRRRAITALLLVLVSPSYLVQQ